MLSKRIYLVQPGARLGIDPKVIVDGHKLFTDFKGAMAENFVLQEFKAKGLPSIFYWKSANTAEVDFLVSLSYLQEKTIFPIEVKSGTDRNTRSLREYQKQNKSDNVFRMTLRNLKQDADLFNIPLYMAGQFEQLVKHG